MNFPLILLLGIGVYAGAQVMFDCKPQPQETNIAPTGVATQSSHPGNARLVIDGNPNTNYFKGSCSHTDYQPRAWWRLDLQHSWQIASIRVVNRGDCCSARLNGAQIRIGNRPDNNNPVCGIITDISLGSSTRLCCHGMEGRYVSVVMPLRWEYLTLCEVEVFPVLQDQNMCKQLDLQPLSSYRVQSLTLNLS
uniref:Pentraxin fusion protein-like n=1 Tax=Geotrypetes seraphini TaxID=260995 RepID=A0A6P8PT86_GEOSA|nr:pentraxin fusion protein-like [Geotrypetes seraphini]